jgi:hypothetical protein
MIREQATGRARVWFIPRGRQLKEGFEAQSERRSDETGLVEFTPVDANLISAVPTTPLHTAEDGR